MNPPFHFAGATFDPDRGELAAGGTVVSLRPRTGEVLRCLLEQPRAVLAKDALISRVWADLVVTENSLAQCIREIRRALGDADESLVRTVPRRGYLLDADVSRAASEADRAGPSPTDDRRLSIVVLPFADLGGDPDQEYFAAGLAEDLTTDLGRIPSAFVISRETANAYRGTPIDLRAIGRELGVRYAVEGSVRRMGDEVVVNLALCDARSASRLWAERFEGSRAQLQALQRSMLGRVAQDLYAELYHAEARRIEQLADPDAQDLAMRAHHLHYRLTRESNSLAHELALRAVKRDPRCWLGWRTLASCHIGDIAMRWTGSPAESLDAAEEGASRARAIDPEAVGASWGIVLVYRERFEEAIEELDRQIAINPNIPPFHQWKGIAHILAGRPELALSPLHEAVRIGSRDPRLSTYLRNIAVAHLHLHGDERALVFAERSVRVPGVFSRSYETLAAAYGCCGMLDEGRAAVAELLERWPRYTISAHRAEQISHRPAFVAQRERYLEGLRRTGLPES